MIIGITGTNGAGKGVVVDYLVQEKGFTHYSASGYLSELLKERGIDIDRTNLRAVGNEMRATHGPGYLVELFLKQKDRAQVHDVVIESIRSTGEALQLKKRGGILLVVDAERPLRYERIYARGTGKDKIDFETFVEQEEREWYGILGDTDMNIRKVIEMADYTLLNNGTLGELHAQIDDVLTKVHR